MARKSSVFTKHDDAGDYEQEIFDCPNPERVIVCSHGRGVRRWDGEQFFYAVAEHYDDSAVLLVDQFQHDEDTIILNPLPTMVSRVNELIDEAKRLHPSTPIVVLGHSNGCGVATLLDLSDVTVVVLLAPAAGSPFQDTIDRFGEDIVNGKVVLNKEGRIVDYTAGFISSVKGIAWPDEYKKLARRYHPTYVFEAGDDDVIGDERFVLRDIPFTKYEIIKGATHNLAGRSLADFFAQLDLLL